MHTGFHGNLFEGAVTTVVEKEIALPLHTPGSALHGHALIVAMRAFAELRKVIDVHVEIAGTEQVYVAIAIIVSPRGAGAEAAPANAGFFRDVFKFAIAEVTV